MRLVFLFLILIQANYALTQTKTTKPVVVKKPVADTGMNNVEFAIDVFSKDPDLKHASISFFVKNTKTGEEIAAFNPDMSLVPASTMKVVTTAAAMEILGGGYKYKTHIQYNGYIDTSCVLHGDIIIKGAGDPTLGSRFFSEYYYTNNFLNEWAKAIRNFGIDSIDGRIVGDASIYGDDPTPQTWIYGDLGNYYGAPPNGLTIFDNTCYLEFKSGNSGDSAALVCTDPMIPGMEFDNYVKGANSTEDNSYILGPPFQFNRIITGTIPKNRAEFEVKGSIPDPAMQAAFELQMSLHNIGIGVNGGYTTYRNLKNANGICDMPRKDIFIQESPSVSSIIYFVNMNSVNLFAEHLCIQIGHVKYSSGRSESGAAAITDHWKKRGIDTEGLYMYDGCGLSRHNAISARHLTDIMVYMSKSRNASAWESTLPVAGKSGTMANYGKGTSIAGNVRAKTGTMSRVKSLSGYVKTKSGEKLAFTIIANNYKCSYKEITRKFEKVLLAMVNYK